MARKAPETRLIPKGSKEVTRKGIDAVVYVNTKELTAIGYHGKSTKHDFYYRFPKKEMLTAHVKEYFDRRKKADKEKADRAAAIKAFKHNVKVGDIFADSWGYDQTNVDFYEVVAVPSDKSVKIRQIKQETVETGFMSGNTVPLPGEFRDDAPVVTRIVKPNYRGDGGYIKSEYGWCAPWDGKPQSCSWYA